MTKGAGGPGQDVTIRQALTHGVEQLSRSSPCARLDAEVLLAHCLSAPRSYLFAWPQLDLSDAQNRAFDIAIDARKRGMPVAYITGRREFYSLELSVSPATLIPRPETELMVEHACERLPANRTADVLELGTGSGAVAIAIALERPRARIVATDISAAALAIARANLERHSIGNVELRQGDWFTPVQPERFDLIVVNPPYVAQGDPCLTEGDVAQEPGIALRGGPDGLDAIRSIASAASRYLHGEGTLIMEHGSDQQQSVYNILHRHGMTEIHCEKDLAGHDRLTVAQRA